MIALVYNGVKDVATVTAVDGSGKATIEGTISGNPSDGDDVSLAYPAAAVSSATPAPPFPFTPNPACWNKVKGEQDGTLDYIQDNIDFRIGNGKFAVNGSDASLKSNVSMPSYISIWKLTLQDESSNPLPATSLSVSVDGFPQAAGTSNPAKSAYYLCIVPSMLPSGKLTISAAVGAISESPYTFQP